MVKRPSILKQDDLKELDELDHDGDEGWAGKKTKKSAPMMSTGKQIKSRVEKYRKKKHTGSYL